MMDIKYEYNAEKELRKAEEKIRSAIKDGCKVWIRDKTGNRVILDENCKIEFMKIHDDFKI